jgi:hypothetical protein
MVWHENLKHIIVNFTQLKKSVFIVDFKAILNVIYLNKKKGFLKKDVYYEKRRNKNFLPNCIFNTLCINLFDVC